MTRLQVDGQSIEARPGDSVLAALLRAGLHPTGGGCLCLGGDCPNCLVTANGVAYTRSCQVKAVAGMVVRRDHAEDEAPPLLSAAGAAGRESAAPRPAPARHVHCDTVVIGQGDSGRRAAAAARARTLPRGAAPSATPGSGASRSLEKDVGKEVGQEVVTLDAREGQHVTGVYPGPLVVASDDNGRVLHVHPRREIVVATGSAEILPVVPGSGLEGLMTIRAAAGLAAAGIDFGRIVSLGVDSLGARHRSGGIRVFSPGVDAPAEELPGLPEGFRGRRLPLGKGGWELLRFEGRRRIEAVVVRPHDNPVASERRVECDTAILDLGRQPRTALARMASDLPVRVVGSAAEESALPPCPREGTVCPCSGVTVDDLNDVWQRGFREMELLKRATLAGTGTCQGGVCLPYLRSFLLERGGRLQPAFTARPLNRQLTVRELAAGAHTAATARMPLHDEHLRLGARMDRAGGWWRPWTYGRAHDEHDEYTAVRAGVSLGDLSSLGKMAIAGPDAEAFLERIVPTRVATIGPGRCRYVLMLDERGYALDDGILCREEDQTSGDRFFLTSTSGGSGFLELWLRDWAEAFGVDIRILNRTFSLATINVTGPRAARLLARAGARDLPRFGRHRRQRIAGIDCRVVRLSFTGELSYELHHAAADAGRLWRRLLALGGDLNVRPHGLEALLRLRLEKGHIVVGQDTDYDSTPRRLGHEWAVDMTKGDFIGRQAIVRTNRQPPDRRLVVLEMVDHQTTDSGQMADSGSGLRGASLEGAVIRDGDRYAGHVTSAATPRRESGRPESGQARSGPESCGSRGASAGSDGAGRGTPGSGVARAGTGIAMLGWLYMDEEGNLPREVTIDGRAAYRVDGPLHDPDGERARVAIDLASEPPEEVRDFPDERLETADMETDSAAEAPAGVPRLRPLEATRVAARPEALDDLTVHSPWSDGALDHAEKMTAGTAGTAGAVAQAGRQRFAHSPLVLRIAPDELLLPALPDFEVSGDPHAIVERETGFHHVWLGAADAAALLERECDWQPSAVRPTLAQGEVAGIPVKLWFEARRTLLLAPSPFAAAFQRRLDRALRRDSGGAA